MEAGVTHEADRSLEVGSRTKDGKSEKVRMKFGILWGPGQGECQQGGATTTNEKF